MIVTYAHSTWNRHIWDVEISTLTAIAKIQIAGELTYSLSSLLTKLSLSVFILRIIARSNRKMYERCIIYGMIAQCALTISFYFTVLLQCRFVVLNNLYLGCIGTLLSRPHRPLRAYWDLEPSYPHICINQDYAMLTFGILNTTTDFFSFFIPMPMIWKLQLPLRQRLAVFSIFGLGCLVCLSAIARVYIDDLALRRTYDITWWVWPECLVTTLEIDIGVVRQWYEITVFLHSDNKQICASLPALRPLFARIWPRLLESVRSGKILWNSSPRGSEQGHSDISERDDQPEKVRNGDVVWKREYIVVNEPKDDIESNLSNVRV